MNDLLIKIGGQPAPSGSSTSSFNLLAEEKIFLEEALARLRQRFTQEKTQWQQILGERDALIGELKSQITRLEEESGRVRQDQATLRAEWEAQAGVLSLEMSGREAELSRQALRHEQEIALYQKQLEDMESARREEAELHSTAIKRWELEEKNRAELLRLREDEVLSFKSRLEELEAQRKGDRAGFNEDKRKAEKALREEIAQTVEQTQALRFSLETREAEVANFQKLLHLSQEEIAEFTRKLHAQEKELKVSHEHVTRLEGDLHTLREAWEMERGHWRELWERERASREKWYDNMREWETHLRQEREAWLNQFQAEAETRQRVNQKVERNVDRLKEVVWSLPVFSSLARPAAGEARRTAGASPFAFNAPSRSILLLASALAGVLLLGGTFLAVSSGFRRVEFASPTPFLAGITTRDRQLWYTDWMSGQLLEARTRRPEKIQSFGIQSSDLHPVSVRWAADHLWSLDTWKRVLTEHRPLPPFVPLRSWTLPLNAPIDFAWDGQGFWVLDQSDPILRRFAPGDFSAPDKETALPPDWQLTALDHSAGEFWAYDESIRRLRRFTVHPRLEVKAEYRLPVHEGWSNPLTGLHVSEKRVWTLSEKSLKVFRWSKRTLAWKNLWRKLPFLS